MAGKPLRWSQVCVATVGHTHNKIDGKEGRKKEGQCDGAVINKIMNELGLKFRLN